MASKKPLLLLAAALLLFLAPVVLLGEVIYPHDNAVEMGFVAVKDSRLSDIKFSDASSLYVPEIHEHLHGARSGWLSLWNPHVELGRPTTQTVGVSPAFVLTRVVSWTSDDAFVVYTRTILLTVVLTAAFAFLFLRALGLDPWACAAGAAGLSTGVWAAYWLTMGLFLAGMCWTLCLLWLVARYVERASFARALGIAFATYALLLTGYPQEDVWSVYLIAGFAIVRVVRAEREMGSRARVALALVACAAAGVACAAPVYLDLALEASRSSRLAPDVSFFLARLPNLEHKRDVGVFLAQAFDAFSIGHPFAAGYPERFGGVSLTPFFCGLVLVSWLEGLWRKSWPWLAYAGVALGMELWPAAYRFGIERLGLGLSAWPPMGATLIPFAVCGAIALDRIVRNGFEKPARATAYALLAPAIALLAIRGSHWSLDPRAAAIGAAILALFVALLWTRRTVLVAALVLASVAGYGARLVLARPEREIRKTSALVESLRASTTDGSRYALVGPNPVRLLPPNQEALLGLRSVHSYDSLSSHIYQDWTRRVSAGGTREYGRWFKRIDSDARLGDDEISWSGIGVVASTEPVRSARFEEIGSVGAVRLWKTREPPRLEAQIDGFERIDAAQAKAPGALADQRRLEIARTRDLADVLEFETTPVPRPTLLFASQQFHPQWRAFADGRPVETVLVNGFYQGAIVPPDTRSVELRFLPFARWSWIPQALFAVLALVAVARGRFNRSSPRR